MARNTSLNWTTPIFTTVIYPAPSLIVNPNDSYSAAQGYAAYGCFVAVLVLVFIALLIKMALHRNRFRERNAALRQNIARQNHLSTVSRSVDANSNYSNDEGNNNRRGSDATLKIDLPPTYEDVMKNFVDEREREATTTTSPESSVAVETRDTHGIVGIEIFTIPTSGQRSVV